MIHTERFLLCCILFLFAVVIMALCVVRIHFTTHNAVPFYDPVAAKLLVASILSILWAPFIARVIHSRLGHPLLSSFRTVLIGPFQVAQLKGDAAQNAKELETALKRVEKLEGELSTSTSKFTTLENRHSELSRELEMAVEHVQTLQDDISTSTSQLAAAREELKTCTLSIESKNREIVILTEQLEQSKGKGADKEGQLATAHEQLQQPLDDLFTSTTQLAAVNDELHKSTLYGENKDQNIISLKDELKEWRNAGASKDKRVAVALRQIKKLEEELSASTSQLVELRGLYDAQLWELTTVHEQLETSLPAAETKGHTIEQLEAEVTRRAAQVEKLQDDVASATSELAEFQNQYEPQSCELEGVCDKLHESGLSGETKDRRITRLTAGVKGLQGEVTQKADQLAVALADVGKLQHNIFISTSDLADPQKRYGEQSRELATALEDVKKLRGDISTSTSTSTSQLSDPRGRHDNQSLEFSAVYEELKPENLSVESKDLTITTLNIELEKSKGESADNAKQLGSALEHVEKLRNDISTFTLQLANLERRYDEQSRELTDVRGELHKSTLSSENKDLTIASLTEELGEWRGAGASKDMRVAVTPEQVEKLEEELFTFASTSKLTGPQTRYDKQFSELNAVRDELQTSSPFTEFKDDDVASLTARIAQLAAEAAEKEEKFKKIEGVLSTVTSRFVDLQDRHSEHSEQSCELIAVRGEHEPSKCSYSEQTEDLEQFHRDLASGSLRIKTLDDSNATKAEELTTAHTDLRKRHRDLPSASSQITDFQHGYAAQSLQLEQWKDSDAAISKELSAARKQLAQMKQRHDEQSRALKNQLESVQRFVTTADVYADTMIIQMLQKLNAEVQQNTTYIAECILGNLQSPPMISTEGTNLATERVSERIGETLVDRLRCEDLDELDLYLPIAFQAYLAYHLCGIISSWTIERGHNDVINAMYQRLQEDEAQMISGRWRSLTRTYIRPTCISHPSTLIDSTVDGLSDIIVAAGCAISASDAETKIPRFRDKVSSIIKLAGQFSKMIGAVVSSDFEVMAIRPDEMFEETTMEEDKDNYDEVENGTAAGQKVLCSTQLGLVKRVPLELREKRTLQVMKAKVLLESFLDG